MPGPTADRSDPAGFDAGDLPQYEPVTDARDQYLGRYRLCYEIASGGMATVYLGRVEGPAGFDRPVAIKRIHRHLAKKRAFVEMFLDEARLAARLGHPNVCAVFDFGQADGAYYMAMEYLAGVPLSELMRAVASDRSRLESPRWVALAARIAGDAAEGLHAAHELRDASGRSLHVVHRDVSPQNVFVTHDGVVKVVDFGIARAAQNLHQTETGTLKGKLRYMAPEQAEGGPIDRRADLFALGICLWEMLAGRHLFKRASEVETLVAVRGAAVPPPSHHNPAVPPELDEIVARALSRDPERRWASGRELAKALHEVLRRHPEPSAIGDLAEYLAPLFRMERTQQLEMLQTVMRSRSTDPVGREDAKTDPLPAIDAPGAQAPNERAPITASIPDARALDAVVRSEIRRSGPHAVVSSRRRVWLAVAGVAAAIAAITAGVLVAASGASDPAASAPALAVPPSPRTSPASEPAVPELAVPVTAPLPAEPEGPAAAPPREPTSPTPARAYGTVQISGAGTWATVYEGARRLGETPLSVRLPAGRHTLVVRPRDELPGRRMRVEVRAGETTRLTVR